MVAQPILEDAEYAVARRRAQRLAGGDVVEAAAVGLAAAARVPAELFGPRVVLAEHVAEIVRGEAFENAALAIVPGVCAGPASSTPSWVRY